MAAENCALLASVRVDMPPAMVLFLFLLAMGCEFVDSSLGMGYGTILTPLLMLAGFSPLQIVPAVLCSECLTGFTAGLLHHRDGNIDFLRDSRARMVTAGLLALTLAGVSMAVVVAGRVPKFYVSVFITIMVTSIGLFIVATAGRRLRFRGVHLLILGIVAAFNKGVSGGGYGPLVTGGQVVGGLSPKHAVAITSLGEAVTCLLGVIMYFWSGHQLAWSLAVPMTCGAMLGVPLATLAVRWWSEEKMRRGVGAITFMIGLIAMANLL